MPFDSADYQRTLTDDEARDLAVLKAARALLVNRRRWGKGSFSGGSRMCILQAVNRAADFPLFPDRICRPVQLRLQRKLPDPLMRLYDYNDAKETKHVDILRLFDAAIAELETHA
jgi:hypothetical protein